MTKIGDFNVTRANSGKALLPLDDPSPHSNLRQRRQGDINAQQISSGRREGRNSGHGVLEGEQQQGRERVEGFRARI